MHERDLFIAALEIDDPTARREYLDQSCLGDPALRVRIERLLSRAAEAGDFLEQPAADLCSDIAAEVSADDNEPSPTDGEPPTMIGQVDDTAQTIVVKALPTVGSNAAAPLPSGLTEAASVFGTLFGRYEVERVLGSGGMGVVYLAKDLRLGRRVALKIPKFDAEEKLNLIERFRREARTMASVLHRNLCPIFDVDEQDGTHYLTMAYIDGESLSQVIKQGSSFTAWQIADLIRKLALALDAAHRAGVIHRDLKPANVMIDRSGEPILMDFGLAWMAHESDARVTQSGAIVGTPAYMSPEQAEGDAAHVSAASDIYSLGAILYELLAGRPIHSGNVTRVLFEIIHQAPTRPSEFRDEVDPKLEEICWKAIARRPEDRFATAADFAAALAQFMDGPLSFAPLTRSVSEGEGSTKPGISSVLKRSPSLTLRVSDPERTEVLPQDSGAETIVYSQPQAGRHNKSRTVLASLLLIGVIAASWAIVANRMKPISENNLLRQSDDAKSVTANSATDVKNSATDVTDEATDVKPTPLFNHQDLTGWGAPVGKANWEVKDGVLTGVVQAGDSGLLPFVGRTFENFELRVEVRLLRGTANSGVYLVSVQPNVYRYQVEISPSDTEFSTGSIAQAGDWKWLGVKQHRLAPDGEWNELVVIANGSQLTSRVNGQPVASISGAAANQVKTLTLELDGRAGAGVIEFRKLEIREIVPKPAASAPPPPPPAIAPFDAQQARAHQEAWAKHLRVEVETTNSVGAKMILLPPGEFLMGAPDDDADAQAQEKPQHKVTLTKPFYIGATEVTVGQFRQFVEATKYVTEAESDGQGAYAGGGKARNPEYVWSGLGEPDEKPVRFVSWEDARRFCDWLSQQEDRTYRLPTDAEWEFACRAGTTTRYWFGNEFDQAKANSTQGGPSLVRVVGQYPANPFGLFDMHGNINEICWDGARLFSKEDVVDPIGPLEQSLTTTVRGGACTSTPARLRSSQRYINDRRVFPESNFATLAKGFRVVAAVEPTKPLTRVPPKAVPLKLEAAGQLPSVTKAAGLKLGDLDGDGDLDLFVATLRAPCVMLRNDGKGVFTDSGQLLGDNASYAVDLGDLDGDGDLDAFVVNTDNQENSIWLNDGRGMFQRSEQTFPPRHSNDVALTDVDGDKDLDAVVSHWNGSVEIWTNDGTGKFTSRQTISQKSNTGIALGDLDGDGVADLVTTSLLGDNHVLLNDGQGHFSETGQRIEHANSTSVALGDLDQDGDLDLFFTTNHGNQVWFNDGHGRFQASEQRLGDGNCEAVALVDLDADRDLDAIPITSGWTEPQARFVWLNDGKGRFQKGPALAAGNTQSLAIGDLDGDGDTDVVFGNLNRPAEVWFNESNQSTIP